MRKQISRLLWLMALPIVLGLAACAEHDNPTDPNPLAKQVSGLWWTLIDYEGEIHGQDFTRMGMAYQLNEDGTGYGVTFFFNDEESDPIDLMGGEGLAPLTYTTTLDGRITADFGSAYKDYADYYKQFTVTYSGGTVTATNGEKTFTLEHPSDATATMIHQWDQALNGGAESAPYHNINDADFNADTWRKQTAIYIWDGSTQLTESNWQDKRNYKLYDLPWSPSSDVLTNLPNGFCDNITPENGWEWVLNRCGGSKIPNNNYFAVYNKYSGILRFFFYMPKTTRTVGNDHVWQVSLTNSLADNSLWGYGLPSAETVKNRSQISPTGSGTQVTYVAPWVEMKSQDGLIVPNEGWWAFDVDLSLYRPNHNITAESIRLQMRSWNTTHASLYSTLTANLSGSIKQTVSSGTSSSTVAKGVLIGVQAAVGITAAVAGGTTGNTQGLIAGLGNLASAFGAGAQLAGLFDDGTQPFEAQLSLGLNGTIDTDGYLRGSASVFDVPSPSLQMKDFYLNGTHLGQGVWNIKHHPMVYAIKDVRYFLAGDNGITVNEPFNAFYYFFDPTSIEVELNPNVFPSDQIEWMQVDANCVATKDMQNEATDQYRAGLGLQSRYRGKTDANTMNYIYEGKYRQIWGDRETFLDSFDWTVEWREFQYSYWNNSMKSGDYPVIVWKKGSKSDMNREYIVGEGVSDKYAIEPHLFREVKVPAFAEFDNVKSEVAEIWLPSLAVNVFVTVKMKGIKEPFTFSRNYLPEINDVKIGDWESINQRIKSHKLSAKQSGHDWTYYYQVYRIGKYLEDIYYGVIDINRRH